MSILSPFRSIDRETRRRALIAAVALLVLLAAHTVLEVARDALFLSRLDAEDLPFTYLAIAGAAWVAAQIDRVLLERFDERRVMALTLLVSSAGTVGFFFLFQRESSLVPHAFYVWIGLVGTFAVTQFWRLLANHFTVAEAKRVYAPIAAGGSLGAVIGAGIGAGLGEVFAPRDLLLSGAGFLLLAAVLPAFFMPAADEGDPLGADEAEEREREEAEVDEQPGTKRYVRLLLALVTITAIVAVLVDFAFKSAVDAQGWSGEALGTFFGRYYVVVNLISLLVQIAIAPRLLAVLGAQRTLVILPALLALGAGGAVLAGGLWMAAVVRGTDGALRHSLHRSAVELLYLPLSRAMRDRHKALIDAIGHRGGQALGSVAILGVTRAFDHGPEIVLATVGVLSTGWAALTIPLRRHYLDLFRANLAAGTVETRVEVPALDLVSLESMMESLNSAWDEEVLATLDLLDEYGRSRVIPALILFHPSREVVLRALEIFASGDSDGFEPVARRLLSSEDEELAAAAMRAVATTLPASELRHELAVQRRSAVRAAVLASLAARGLDEDDRVSDEIQLCAASPDLGVRLSLARAIRLEADPSLAIALHSMTEPPEDEELEPEIARELAVAFGALRDHRAIPWLIEQVGPRSARSQARDAMVAIGRPALDALIEALHDRSLPRATRIHLPRSLSRFGHPRAADALFACLTDEEDGWVRYKALRGLGGMAGSLSRDHLDEEALETQVRRELARAAELLTLRLAVERAHEANRSLATRAGGLLLPVLEEKEEQALDRAVRMIALARPREDLRSLRRGLRRGDRKRRAESRELLLAVTPVSLAAAVDALLDEADDASRLERAALEVPAAPDAYPALLRRLIEDESDAVRFIAAHHAAELGLDELSDPMALARRRASGATVSVIDAALAELARGREETRAV